MEKPAPHLQLRMRSLNTCALSGVVVMPVEIDHNSGVGSFLLRMGLSVPDGSGGWTVINRDQRVLIDNPRKATAQQKGLVLGRLVTLQGHIVDGYVYAEHIEWGGTMSTANDAPGSRPGATADDNVW